MLWIAQRIIINLTFQKYINESDNDHGQYHWHYPDQSKGVIPITI